MNPDYIYILLTFFIALFTGLSFSYQRKYFKSIKPIITRVKYIMGDSVQLKIRIVNPAQHKIALKSLKLIKLFLFIPINSITLEWDNFGDLVSSSTSSKSWSIMRLHERTFIQNEDIIACSLKSSLNLKSKYVLKVKTTAGKCRKIFYPNEVLENINNTNVEFEIDKKQLQS